MPPMKSPMITIGLERSKLKLLPADSSACV
jgi:hypothetical protein